MILSPQQTLVSSLRSNSARVLATLLCLGGLCAVGAPAARAAVLLDVPDYSIQALTLTTTPGESEGPALGAHPTLPTLYATVGTGGGFSNNAIVKVDLSGPTPVVSTFSVGAGRTSGSGLGNDVLNSRFGSVGGIGVLADGSLIVTDNNVNGQGRGDTIYLARDLNNDGDARDIVDVDGFDTSETLKLIDPILAPAGSGFGGFSGVQVEVDGSGTAYLITSDGPTGTGEILKITGAGSPTPAISLFASGFDYGSGLAIAPDGNLYAGNVDGSFSPSLRRVRDLTSDGEALDTNENIAVTVNGPSAFFGIYDAAASSAGRIFLTANYTDIAQYNPADLSLTTFAHDSNPFGFLGDLCFVRPAEPFVPGTSALKAQLAVSDTNGDGVIYLITPNTPTASVAQWELFE